MSDRMRRLVPFVLLASLATLPLAASTLSSMSPNRIRVNSGEYFIHLDGAGFQAPEASTVNYSGPAGEFSLPPNSGTDHSFYVWVPTAVVETGGKYAVTVSSGGATSNALVLEVVNDAGPVLHIPESIVAAATSRDGARVYFAAYGISGNSSVTLRATCDHESGAIYPLGLTTVRCTTADAFGLTATGQFTITVRDTTAPRIHLPGDLLIPSTGPDGARVTFTATAEDTIDGPLTVLCRPASGSLFPIGITTVRCSASNLAGVTTTGSFNVEVTAPPRPPDPKPPVLHLPANITTVATSSAGAIVTYVATAADPQDGAIPVTCTPAPGATFPVGTTVVQCWAMNSLNLTATESFEVRVTAPPPPDQRPPVLQLPADITLEALSSDGVIVSYSASATDPQDGPIMVVCVPPSGSVFPLGVTMVQCSATNSLGLTTAGSFAVHIVDVTPPAIVSITATPSTLWPPNHQMVRVELRAVVGDAIDPVVDTHIVTVTASEPLAQGDWEILGPLTLNLRAERHTKEARVYTIRVESVDDSGNLATGQVQVTVPHDESGGDVAPPSPPRRRATGR
jgi:hypothetical protein